MRVTLIKNDRLRNLNLPSNYSGNFWITDYDENGKESNIINIVAESQNWKLLSNSDIKCIYNDSYVDDIILEENCFYTLKRMSNDELFKIYTSNSYDKKPKEFLIQPVEESKITIGGASCNINLNNGESNNSVIVIENGKPVIYPLSTNIGVYVNKIRVFEKKILEQGDLIFINGLKFLLSGYQNLYKISIYSNIDTISVAGLSAFNNVYEEENFVEEEDIDIKLYSEDDYFHKTPRFTFNIEEKELVIDAPPVKPPEEEMPVLLTIGPMFTMSMSSMVMAFVSISNLKSGRSTLLTTLPSIVMACAMVLGTLLWPTLTRKYEKKIALKKENERIEKYTKYINSRKKIIEDEFNNQTTLLNKSYPNLKDCSSIIMTHNDQLWSKRIEDEDYLRVSLGYGNYPLKLKITYPEEHFSMIEDNLKSIADELSRSTKILNNVPISYSFLDNKISSIIGEYNYSLEYLKKLLFQISTFHSYDDLKIVIFTDDDKKGNWSFIKNTPYCFSDNKDIRFFASNEDEYHTLCNYFEKIISSRKENFKGKDINAHKFDKIYLIVTDSFKTIRKINFITELLEEKDNYGFIFVILNKNISTLPEQCNIFIKVDSKVGSISKNIVNSDIQNFVIDASQNINYNECYKVLDNIPIDVDEKEQSNIPDKVDFLGMYDVGKVEQLNSLNRWNKSNPIESLKVPVGLGKNEEVLYMDLHEKYHGPHGLIAGMTGSGKSEFIITYILSLAVNYHPYEVQFILIDYKGGGLAGAFENTNSGKKLPHLVGVITNLDKTEIKRTLSSIDSELRKRQKLFNVARDKTGESTIDIYKYQKLYREGKVDEPVSHLFIISDEFAELKTQEPEFMEQLISAARIGRSLGIHLILATQKPSGVVDPQIWSNTRFRVCLRVQDKGDSNEVIKCPDAAYLKEAGRYYFQVGYNEVFTLGQSAWSGAKYVPTEKISKKIDTSIDFINNIGQVIKKVETKEKNMQEVKNLGEELTNIVNYLYDIAAEENIKCKPLCLDKIPSFININGLINKYKYTAKTNEISIPIGEYDIPTEQIQSLLTVNLINDGNTLIYGVAGSGKENFIMTLIYSAIKIYTPDIINFYLMDFGVELLNVYNKSSYVGDIINMDDNEKLKNLFKMLLEEIEKRKILLSNYGGSYNEYVLNSGEKLPALVVILNNYEAYQDTYEDYFELLTTITRECTKFGIYFIVTCNTPNGMRFKLKQNFSNIYCLNQNSDDDYSAILGNINKSFPSKVYGRGIFKRDMVYEFQTASINSKEKINETIEEIIDQTNESNTYKAKKVPILPKEVDYEYVSDYIDKTLNMVIGVEKNSLNISKYNFKRDFINIVSANDSNLFSNFENAFINQLKLIDNTYFLYIEADNYNIGDNVKKGLIFDANVNDTYLKFENYVNDSYRILESNNFNREALVNQKQVVLLINGLESFKTKLSENNKLNLSRTFKQANQLGNVNIIIFDTILNIKKSEFEEWFKEGFNSNDGIWLGNGFNDQFTFKTIVRPPEIKEVITDDFCFVIQNGIPVLVKYVCKFDLEEEIIDI